MKTRYFSASGTLIIGITRNIMCLVFLFFSIDTSCQINGYAYIQNSSPDNQISVFDTDDNSFVTSILVGDAPAGSAFHPDGSFMVVCNGYSDDLSIINTQTNTVTHTIPAGDYPTSVCFHPNGLKFYVSHLEGDRIKVFNSGTFQEIADIPMASNLNRVLINNCGNRLYVAARNTNRVYVLNTETDMIVDTIEVDGGPFDLAISDDDTKLYSTNFYSNTIAQIDLMTNAVVDYLVVGANPLGIELPKGLTKLYIGVYGENKIAIVETGSFSLLSEIAVVSVPGGIDFSESLGKIWVTLPLAGEAVVINTSTDGIDTTIMVGGSAHSYLSDFINDHLGVEPLDSDGDGTPDCSDNCPNDQDKLEPGICGCGVSDSNSDGDSVADCNDNCPEATNSEQTDSDCDGVGDACDACAGVDDTIDNNNDGRPDCIYPPSFDQIIPTWKCGNKKVFICHQTGAGQQTLCVNFNAINGHLGHGDFLGPCGSANCSSLVAVGDNSSSVNLNQDIRDQVKSAIELFNRSSINTSEINVYPNPTTSVMFVNLSDLQISEGTLRIQSVTGHKFIAQPIVPHQAVELDLSEYPSGIYFIEVRSAEGRWIKKIIKTE